MAGLVSYPAIRIAHGSNQSPSDQSFTQKLDNVFSDPQGNEREAAEAHALTHCSCGRGSICPSVVGEGAAAPASAAGVPLPLHRSLECGDALQISTPKKNERKTIT
jgi:hypothetical protein